MDCHLQSPALSPRWRHKGCDPLQMRGNPMRGSSGQWTAPQAQRQRIPQYQYLQFESLTQFNLKSCATILGEPSEYVTGVTTDGTNILGGTYLGGGKCKPDGGD